MATALAHCIISLPCPMNSRYPPQPHDSASRTQVQRQYLTTTFNETLPVAVPITFSPPSQIPLHHAFHCQTGPRRPWLVLWHLRNGAATEPADWSVDLSQVHSCKYTLSGTGFSASSQRQREPIHKLRGNGACDRTLKGSSMLEYISNSKESEGAWRV
jgi:hypothetical protein